MLESSLNWPYLNLAFQYSSLCVLFVVGCCSLLLLVDSRFLPFLFCFGEKETCERCVGGRAAHCIVYVTRHVWTWKHLIGQSEAFKILWEFFLFIQIIILLQYYFFNKRRKWKIAAFRLAASSSKQSGNNK